MVKYSKSTLKKLEQLLTGQGYRIIYEKGQFKSGYCLVNDSKIIVINKYYDLEGKINTLLEILPQIDLNEGLFDPREAAFFEQLDTNSGIVS